MNCTSFAALKRQHSYVPYATGVGFATYRSWGDLDDATDWRFKLFAAAEHFITKLALVEAFAALFGAAMLANGVFPTGNPLHGLYGLAIFSILVPVFYASELNPPPALRQA